jgi:hypothetical protein
MRTFGPSSSQEADGDESTPLLSSGAPFVSASFVHGPISRLLLWWGNRHVHFSRRALLWMVFLPILVCAGLSAGVVNMNREERPEKLWLLPDDWVLEARTYRQT